MVLITGAGGQLGRELVFTAPTGVQVLALTRSQLDIADAEAVTAVLEELKPGLVINAAAYTAVDQAESEPELAAAVNAVGPGNLARACAGRDIRLIHVSTDFVFDGESNQPYQADSLPAPVSEYGRGKFEGERLVQEALDDALILRTGWVYSRHGKNFVKTMLGLMAQRQELGVVADQVGTPTWARGLAEAIWAAASRAHLRGIYHWSDAGVCSWYDLAVAICEEACELGLLPEPISIQPIPASSYPTAATRPAYSVLAKEKSWSDFQLRGKHWRVQLRAMLREIKEHEDG